MCVRSLSYPTCRAHGYIDICVWFDHIFHFSHYLIKGRIFGRGGKLLNKICVFWFSLLILPETFLFLRKIKVDMVINVRRSSSKVTCFSLISINLEFSLQDFEKYSKINFNEHSSFGRPVVACGQRDGQTDMPQLIFAFQNFANAPKMFFSWISTIRQTS